MIKPIRYLLALCLLSSLFPAASAAAGPSVACRFSGDSSAALTLEGLDSRVYGVQLELVLPSTYPEADFIPWDTEAYALCQTETDCGRTTVRIYLLPGAGRPLGDKGRAALGTLEAETPLDLPDQIRLTLLDPGLRPYSGADRTLVDLEERSSGGTAGSSGSSGSGGSSSGENDYHRIDVNGADHGSVQVSPSRAQRGETVTVATTPDSGYILGRLTVVDSAGTDLELQNRGDGIFTFSMPRARVEIQAEFHRPETFPDQSGGVDYDTWGGLPYLDVKEDDWFWEAVFYAHHQGLMNGIGAQYFGPSEPVTRGMIVTILYRLEGSPAASLSRFLDVPEGEYYSSAVAWASASGVIEGYGDGRFGPNDPITREQMAVILHRYVQYKHYSASARTSLSGYADAGEIGLYAQQAMQWANAEQLITGTSATTLSPRGQATRSQAAAILMRFCRQIAQ